jgi:UDP-perosamine 4-acetyltransferase
VSRPTEVVVLGSGGHAVVCIDILSALGYSVVGALGAPGESDSNRVLQVPLLGGDDELPGLLDRGVGAAFVAIGDNRARGRLMTVVREVGLELVSAVSPAADLSPSVVVGANVAVMAGAVVNAYSTAADGVIVNTAAGVDHDVHLAALVHVGPGCHLAGRVAVAEGAFLGIGSTVIPGCRIGSWSQLGAGSVVVGDIADGVLALGVPAREVKRLHE